MQGGDRTTRIDELYEAAQKATPGRDGKYDVLALTDGRIESVKGASRCMAAAFTEENVRYLALVADPQTVAALIEVYRAAKAARAELDELCEVVAPRGGGKMRLWVNRSRYGLRAAIEKVEGL